jgi:diguanylate cyclase (GGDEF)-like protein/PAS domain S-box-containing protein
MLKSLNEQSRTLAEAWERERQLVADAKASEERYILSTQAANGGLWDWDLQTGIVFYADRWKTLAGYAEEEINDTPEAWLSLVHAEDRPSLLMALDLLIAGGSSTIEHEHRLCRPDGTYRWKLCRALAVVGADGVATRIVGSLTDINERKELEDRLRRAALYDGLTGLPNRTLFLERLGRAVERAHSRKQTPFAVLFLDLDGFKGVNDTKGHGAGDELLVQVAQRIEHTLRGSDTAARLGGDEFAVLVDDVVGNDDAGVVSERLRRALSEPYQLSSAVVTVTTSIGVAHSTSDLDNPEEILREADFDMYRAKIAARATPPGPLHTAVP